MRDAGIGFGWQRHAGLLCVWFGPWALHLFVARKHWTWGHDEEWCDGPFLFWGLGPLLKVCWNGPYAASKAWEGEQAQLVLRCKDIDRRARILVNELRGFESHRLRKAAAHVEHAVRPEIRLAQRWIETTGDTRPEKR